MPMPRRHRALPPARTLPWPLRPLGSAETSLSIDALGRLVMRIAHANLPGLRRALVSSVATGVAERTA